MNFLAHIYLSGSDPMLTIGNFIADHVKGKAIDLYPEEIQKGIILHRKIDFFTDHHPVVEKTKKLLRIRFKKYAPVVGDIFYDHFLAIGWDKYSNVTLEKFAVDFYKLINTHLSILPERTQKMVPFMISNNLLVSYSKIEGIESVLKGMAKRTSFVSGMENGGDELRKNYEIYKEHFDSFFPELVFEVLEK